MSASFGFSFKSGKKYLERRIKFLIANQAGPKSPGYSLVAAPARFTPEASAQSSSGKGPVPPGSLPALLPVGKRRPAGRINIYE